MANLSYNFIIQLGYVTLQDVIEQIEIVEQGVRMHWQVEIEAFAQHLSIFFYIPLIFHYIKFYFRLAGCVRKEQKGLSDGLIF